MNSSAAVAKEVHPESSVIGASDGTAKVSAGTPSVVSHFWVVTYPAIQSTLFVVPGFLNSGKDSDQARRASEPVVTTISLYDSDGAQINSAKVIFPAGRVGILELEPFMGNCKLEAGLKHAHLRVESPVGTRHHCRIASRNRGLVVQDPQVLSVRHGTFVPITLGADRTSMLAFVNHGDREVDVRCRLFSGRRTPDTDCVVPAYGSRLLCIEEVFQEYAAKGTGYPAYARLSVRHDGPLGVQLLERVAQAKNAETFSAL